MRLLSAIIIFFFIIITLPHSYAQSNRCESGHRREAIEGNGKIIKLEDGSIWEVEDIDTVITVSGHRYHK